MSALISGSYAYDTIMVFQDKFKNHILPDQIHILNVCFLVPEMRREFGGCAGNIAYGLHMLGGDALPMATVGHDFTPYADWMDRHGIKRDCIKVIKEAFTAQAYITTDLDDNQVTAFHPGAMSFSHMHTVSQAQDISSKDISIGIVAPNGRDGMVEHAAQFSAAGIPFIFDPGQGLPMFGADDLHHFIEQASWVTVNDYEFQLMSERTGLSVHELAEQVEALIVTRGGEGSHIYTSNQRIEIPAAKTTALADPTGCGDAYRAGLLYGLMKKMDWETTGRIAALMGAIKIEQHGTQNYQFTQSEFEHRYKESFGQCL